MAKFSFLIAQNGFEDNWSVEPVWYKNTFESLGCKVIPFYIPFYSTHSYNTYPSATRVLRHRLKSILEENQIDVAFIIHGGGYWSYEMIGDLRDKGVLTIYYNPDDPMLFNSVSRFIAPHCDVVLAFPKVVPVYEKELGIKAHPFHYCMDPAIEFCKNNFSAYYASDVTVAGNIDSNRKRLRGEFLLAIKEAGFCDVAYYGINRLDEFPELKPIYRGDLLNNQEHARALRSSKIVFHYAQELTNEEYVDGLSDRFQSISGRHFDGAGAGSLVLTNYFVDLETGFDIGKELVVYYSLQDAIDKIRYYLKHEDERIKIAEAGRKRALKDHIISIRAKQIFSFLENVRAWQ